MPGKPSIERHECKVELFDDIHAGINAFRLATGVPQPANGTNDAREAADA